MNKDLIVGAFVAALTLSVMYSSIASTSSVSGSHVSALYETAVCVYKNGVQVGECSHNTIPNAGLNWTRDKLSGLGGAGSANVIALGNASSAENAAMLTINTTAGTNAPIADCTLTPQTVTPIALTGSTGNYSLSYQWTSTCSNEVVNTTAIYNSTTGTYGTSNLMFAGKNFSAPVTLQSGDQLNVTWYIWVVSS